MTAVDTNIIVRFLVRDDDEQAQKVYRRMKRAEANKETLYVSLIVLVETIWVLQSAYDKSRKEVLEAIDDMRRMPVLEFQNDEAVEKLATRGLDHQADLCDQLIAHAARSDGCDGGITFDRGAAGLPFFELLR